MRRPWIFGLALVALVLVAVILWRVFLPASSPAGILLTNGRIEGDQAVIGAKIGGKIVQLTVHEGDRVEAGGLIAALASEQLQAQLEQAEHVVHLAREELAASRARVVSSQRQVEAAATAVTLADDGALMVVEPIAGDKLEDNLNPVGRLYYAASTVICVPTSLAQEVGLALGAQAGEGRLREVMTAGGFTRVRRAAETPFNMVLEARP